MPLPSKKELTIVGALLAAYLLFSFWLDHNRVPRWYQTFHQAQLRGVLASSAVGKLRVSLRVAPDLRTLCFFPIDSQGYAQNHLFGQLAAPGDSIRKSSNSDTLYLLKNGRAYLFVAKKPNLYLAVPLE